MGAEMFSLEGKVALVTGASRGIGRAIAIAFAEAGADVGVAARNGDALEEVAAAIREAGRRAAIVPTDVTDRAQIEAMVEAVVTELGGLDVLVNNAGGTRFRSPLLGLRPDGWDKVLALNLDSTFHATQIAARHMVDHGGGSIIQMASVAGVQGAETLAMYSAAKGGVRLFSQAVARELASSGVRVNSIAPGWIATDLNESLRATDDAEGAIVATIPMGRWGAPDDVVGAALYLASDASAFVTGATLIVDGGQTA